MPRIDMKRQSIKERLDPYKHNTFLKINIHGNTYTVGMYSPGKAFVV